MKTLYKVLKDDMVSPFQYYTYELHKEYHCDNFDSNPDNDCSHGFYATDMDGIIYCYRHYSKLFECQVWGAEVEINQFKRRYENIKLVREVTQQEIKQLAKELESEVGYKLEEALFPINPLVVERNYGVTKEEIGLLKQWISVQDNMQDSIQGSIKGSIQDSIWHSVLDSVWGSVWGSVLNSVWSRVWGSVLTSVADSVLDGVLGRVWGSVLDIYHVYISSLFPNIKKWKYIDHTLGENPFQPCIDLLHKGLIPSFDGNIWRLHSGKTAEIVYELEA